MLGAGGMGTVVKAWDSRLERAVAIKVPPPHLASHPDFRTRFLREARALARLAHENIGRVYDVPEVSESDIPVMILEFLDGLDLAESLQSQGLPPGKDAFRWILEAGTGLAHAHGQGILHRDIKPSNLMLVHGKIKILDFGLAALSDRTGLTQSGMLLGSIPFMPPEQLRGEKVDSSADQYALAVTGFQLLTGRMPFSEDDALRLQVPRLSQVRAGIPASLDATLARAMSPEPKRRFESTTAFVRALQGVARDAR
jgi:serine/threonine-protein kinase